MTDEITDSKTAAGESSLPFRVLLPRAIGATLLGGFTGWFLCYVLGHLFFPSAFKNPRVDGELLSASSLCVISAGSGCLCWVLWKGNLGAKAIASVICLWFGSTFFFVPLVFVGIITYSFINGKMPQQAPNSPPNLLQLSPLLMLWSNLISTIAGAWLLHQFYKHYPIRTFSEWLSDMRDAASAILKPQAQHQLERFILHSPFSPEECRKLLPQIANIQSSKFAFWETLPLPGLKPLVVKVEVNNWSFTSRYKRSSLVFDVTLTETDNSTQLTASSRWMPVVKIWLLIFGGFYAFWCACLVVMAVGGFIVTLIQKPSIASFLQGLFFAFAAFLMWVFSWLYILGFFRNFVWRGRKQELMIIEAMERVLEAQIIERETVRYKWGLFEEKAENVPTAS